MEENKNKNKTKFAIVVSLLAFIAIVAYLIIPKTPGISYEEFLKNVKTDSNYAQEYYDVEAISNKDGIYTYRLTSQRTGDSYEVTSTNEYKDKVIQGMSYTFTISYPEIEEVYKDAYYSCELGDSYTEKEYEKFQNVDYENEIKEYYEKNLK